MPTNVLDLQALTSAAADAVDQEHLVARTLVPPTDDPDEDLEKLWLKERGGAAVEVGARVRNRKVSLAEILQKANAFITAPLGRGKTSLRGLLARDLLPDRSLLWIHHAPGVADLIANVERTYPLTADGQPIARAFADPKLVLAVDDWEQYDGDQRRAVEMQAAHLQRAGTAFVFLGTANASPPRLTSTRPMRPLRLLPFTPADCTSYLYKRLPYPARAVADDLVNRLAPLSREGFFISVIADYFASGRDDAEDISLTVLMREQMDAQLGSRCTPSDRMAIGPWLKRLALQGPQITFEAAAASAQAIAHSLDPSRLLNAACDAGLLIRRSIGQYEFSHALWRAFVVVDSFNPASGIVESPGNLDDEFRRAQARLLPLVKTHEPKRTEILRDYVTRDLSAYMAAVSTLSIESTDRNIEQYVRSFVAGVDDIAHVLSPRARALVEPWNGYPETEAEGPLGAVYGKGTFEMRVRKAEEAQLIPVEDARERTQFTPPAAVARGIGTSRQSGAKFCLDQLRSLWKSNVLPLIPPLACEQLFFWSQALQIHATPSTLADIAKLAGDNMDNLLFEDDAWIGGEYLARWHRLNQRQAGFGISGPELLRLVSMVDVDSTTPITSLAHAGPDLDEVIESDEEDGRPRHPYRRYSVARREERVRSIMNAAIEAFHSLLQNDFAFLVPHSPLRYGPVTFRVTLESDGERVHTSWEPSNDGDGKVVVASQPKQLIPSFAEIDARLAGRSSGLKQMSYYAMSAGLDVFDWSPVSMPATFVVCKFLLKCLGDALGERYTFFL